ncbi:RNAse P Rpr2/Rpp21/SNM1 subunit domain-containing protein, partial [Lineolata rhizophorae]
KSAKSKSIPNRHLHARISYLYQAASYFASQHIYGIASATQNEKQVNDKVSKHHSPKESLDTKKGNAHALPTHFNAHLLAVSRKSQSHLSPALKRSICRRCHAHLVPGATSSHRVANASRGGRKPWADVLVVRCALCGAEKRFPVGQERQAGKKER